jgi:hypothetical protein
MLEDVELRRAMACRDGCVSPPFWLVCLSDVAGCGALWLVVSDAVVVFFKCIIVGHVGGLLGGQPRSAPKASAASSQYSAPQPTFELWCSWKRPIDR